MEMNVQIFLGSVAAHLRRYDRFNSCYFHRLFVDTVVHCICWCTFCAVADGCLEYVVSGSSYGILFEVKFCDSEVLNLYVY